MTHVCHGRFSSHVGHETPSRSSMAIAETVSEWVTWQPTEALRPFVDRYIGYHLAGFPPAIHRGLPSRHMTFIVSIGDEIDVVAQTDPLQTPARYRTVMSGLQARPAEIAHNGRQEGVAIELTPLGARALLGMPARALWNTSVEFEDLVGAAGGELWERLQPPMAWAERFLICDEVLGRLVQPHEVEPTLAHAWQLLVAGHGTRAVADLANAVGWTRQHMTRRFSNEFGLSPKLAGRVVRFERARRMLQGTPPFVSIAQVAAACGYYDQAHLTRDFVELAGCPPAKLVAEEVPSFQDDSALDGASSAP